ncbi:uncharacterized protein Ga0466249_001535 [Sporomusaceae bacterium BoRhaA]|nr:uncharacterized protein [Pelorhabdus rhamnosifermentans]
MSDIVYKLIDYYSEYNFNEAIRKCPQYTREQLLDGWKEIDHAITKNGLFSTHYPSQMIYLNNFKDMTHQQLILNITERCNLRCSYCIYSGKYKGKRVHSERDMDFETAKVVLDKFLRNAADEVVISFYGGEPLLNFELIKRIVKYVEGSYKKNISWNMTTNGTLLTLPICDFLYKKNFSFAVSLDGPQTIHDRYRKLSNGEGSYDTIVANLRYLQWLDEDFYRKNISFSIVNAPPVNLTLINDFFTYESLVNKNKKFFSYMRSKGVDGFDFNSTTEDYDDWNNCTSEFFKRFPKDAINNNVQNSLIENMHRNDFLRFYNRAKTPLEDAIYPNGCCLPGFRRLFVSIDHKLYVCEKMDHCYEIGTVEDWIDTSRIEKLFDEYIAASLDCFNCWACRICSNCFNTFLVNGRIDKNIHETQCETTRSSLTQMLVNYYSILEENLSAFDYMKDMEPI